MQTRHVAHRFVGGLVMVSRRPFSFVFVFLFLLSGCAMGPGYEKRVQYLPPQGDEAKVCLQQCDAKKVECEQNAKILAEDKKIQAKQEYAKCMGLMKKGGSCADTSYAIEVNLGPCLYYYNQCYQRCGGRVVQEDVCVRNCK
jgi:hypothetical protein